MFPYLNFKVGLGIVSGSIFAVLWSSALFAQELNSVKALPLAMAKKAADAAREKCEADGYKVSVFVVDEGGHPKALVKSDGAGPHTSDSSFRKAYTALSMRNATQNLSNLVKKMPQLASLEKMNDKIILLAGGQPIKFGGDVVGGIGVGGAPGGHLDDACAVAGLKAIGASVPEEKK